MSKLIRLFDRLTAREANARAARIAAAYLHWLEQDQPAFWLAHGDAMARLFAGATPATIDERVATADRLVRRFQVLCSA